jgi:hypothetical protein
VKGGGGEGGGGRGNKSWEEVEEHLSIGGVVAEYGLEMRQWSW